MPILKFIKVIVVLKEFFIIYVVLLFLIKNIGYICTYYIGYINVLLRKVNIFKHRTLSDKA